MTTELAEAIEKVESLRRDIQAKGKLNDEVLAEIHKKFRLECNYHSNRIEGGTLSKAETRSVMIDNITAPIHPEVRSVLLRVGDRRAGQSMRQRVVGAVGGAVEEQLMGVRKHAPFLRLNN